MISNGKATRYTPGSGKSRAWPFANKRELDEAAREFDQRIAHGAPVRANGADASLLLVQNLEEFLHPLERLLLTVAGEDDAIAVALQRFRL